jgi:hypothetical protein
MMGATLETVATAIQQSGYESAETVASYIRRSAALIGAQVNAWIGSLRQLQLSSISTTVIAALSAGELTALTIGEVAALALVSVRFTERR